MYVKKAKKLTTNMSLLALSVDFLRDMLDYFDVYTILHSFRLVCKQLYAVVNISNRFEFKFTSMSKPDPEFLTRCIQPESVLSLVFYNIYKGFDSVNLFFTYFDIR